MKKYFLMFLVSICALFSSISVYAEEIESFQMVEGEDEYIPDQGITNPYNLYLSNVITYISCPGDYDLKLRAEVYCTSTVASIQTKFYLQKKYNGVWKTVSEGTATKTNSNYMYKNMYVYDVTAGEYRCVTDTMVTDSFGYSETMDGYSPSIDVG